MSLYLHALGHFHPDNEITNAFLESLDIGTNDAWIMERVGIRSRWTALPLDYIRETRNRDQAAAFEAADYSLAQMGAAAARHALARAGLEASEIGMLVGGTSAADLAAPAEACRIAHQLELQVPCLDVNSACTSFLAGLHMLGMMRPEALPPYVLLVCAEGMTRTVDYDDRSSAVLWGDAAVAAVLSTTIPSRAQIHTTSFASDPSGHAKVIVPRIGYFEQEGRNVQMFGIRKSTDMVMGLRDRFAAEDRKLHFIGHQANLRMLEAICRRCEIPPERHHYNVDRYGNTAGASGASVVSMRWDEWAPGDDLMLTGVGAGLSWASTLLRFDD